MLLIIILLAAESVGHPSADSAEDDKPAAVAGGGLHAVTGDKDAIAVTAREEKPPSYAEVFGEAKEGAPDASFVGEETSTKVLPVDPADQPSALDEEVRPVSDQVPEPVATGVPEQTSDPAVEVVPTPEPKLETEQMATRELGEFEEPAVDVAVEQAAKKAVVGMETEEGPAATGSDEVAPVAPAEVGVAKLLHNSSTLLYDHCGSLLVCIKKNLCSGGVSFEVGCGSTGSV